MRVRKYEIEGRAGGFGRKIKEVTRLSAPVPLHHDRQPMYHHVEKTANQQAKHQRALNKGQRIAGQKGNYIHV